MLPLIGGTAKHKRLLFPDAAAGKIEPGISKSTPEVQALSIGMENIDAGVIRHDSFSVFERR